MNNNQDLNNTNPTNLNTIPVQPPVPPQAIPQQTVESNQNKIPPVNNIIPTPDDSPNIQNENVISAMNIGDSNSQTQVPLEQQNYNETSITDLNVDGQYNRMEKIPDYVNSPEVRENINPTKKNTITITKEMKTVLIIVGIMLIFIMFMPFLFDLVNKIRFH